MNITISLFRRTGLSKEEVANAKKSLMETVEILKEEVKKTRKELSGVQRDVQFWKAELKKRTTMKKCTKCKGSIDIWPFNDTIPYYIKGDKVSHVVCPKMGVKLDYGKIGDESL